MFRRELITTVFQKGAGVSLHGPQWSPQVMGNTVRKGFELSDGLFQTGGSLFHTSFEVEQLTIQFLLGFVSCFFSSRPLNKKRNSVGSERKLFADSFRKWRASNYGNNSHHRISHDL